MIKLTKGEVPRVLQDNAARWTKELLELLAENPVRKAAVAAAKGKYNHPDVKEALRRETLNKCAYCESFYRHVDYGDIEHMTPKTPQPHLTFDWDNLTIACGVCNTNKAEEIVVDPYMGDPEKRFVYFGAGLMSVAGDAEAQFTELKLQLNRPDLVDERQRRIEHLRALREVIAAADPRSRPILEADFDKELQPGCEYAALSRVFAKLARAAEAANAE